VKVVTDYTHGETDKQLKAVLVEWRQQVHAEFWGGKRDHFLGPAALILDEIVELLCHLSHAHALHTVDDILNNIQGAQCPFIMKHAKKILNLVHSITPTPEISSSKLKTESLPPNNAVQHVTIAAPQQAPYKCKLCKVEGHTHTLLSSHLDISSTN